MAKRSAVRFTIATAACVAALVLTPALGCKPPAPAPKAALKDDARKLLLMDKATWLSKVKSELLVRDDFDALPVADQQRIEALDERAILDQLFHMGGFADFVWQFNLSYLGFQPAQLFTVVPGKSGEDEKVYAPEAMHFRMARDAAQAVRTGQGDYFKTFIVDFDWGSLVPTPEEVAADRKNPAADPTRRIDYEKPFWFVNRTNLTNRNRKRAAWALRTFFCDDLTPLGIDSPRKQKDPPKPPANDAQAAQEDQAAAAHANGRELCEDLHGADPACAACHYKLDPMAALFRYHGMWGTDYGPNATGKFKFFPNTPPLTEPELERYLACWRYPADAPYHRADGRTYQWRAGYFRTAQEAPDDANERFDTLEELTAALPGIPAFRRCFASRLTKYVIDSKNTTFDPAWIGHLADMLGQPDSSTALKSVLKELFTSNAYRNVDPRSGECYDEAPDTERSEIPCSVRETIQDNCTSCHNADEAKGGLDLTQWVSDGAGRMTFKHVKGKQLTRKASFDLLSRAMSSSEPQFRMPRGQDKIDPPQRTALYEWINANR
jgi:hypothetical protein